MYFFGEFDYWWLHTIWKHENKIAEITNYFIVKNLKTHTLHSHWTGCKKRQQFYMATHSAWFSQHTDSPDTDPRDKGTKHKFLGNNND